MDISTLAISQEREDAGVVVHIADAQGELQFYDGERPITITVGGKYSKTYREAMFAQAREIRRRGGIPLPPDEQFRRGIQFVASCILAWEGFTSGDQACPFSRDTAVALLTMAPWIMEQLEDAIFNRRASV